MQRRRTCCVWMLGILFLIYSAYSEKSQPHNKISEKSNNDNGDDSDKSLNDFSTIISPTTEYDYIESTTEENLELLGTPTALINVSNVQQCSIPPAIEQFPRPLIDQGMRRNGAVVIHIFVAIFMFLGLAIVCDDYFVASLNRLCEELKLSPDVAGATFMAAGSSAPELATVIIGVFVAKDDIGISGVIGSAVFNIMFVISVCALCSGTVCQLNWWPLFRDCFFYTISILAMLLILINDYITWYESLIMLLLYVVYCIALRYNSALEIWATSFNLPIKLPTRGEQSALVTYKNIPETSYTQQTQQQQPITPPQSVQPDQDYQAYMDPNVSWDPNAAWDENKMGGTVAPNPTGWNSNITGDGYNQSDNWGNPSIEGQSNAGYNSMGMEQATSPRGADTQVTEQGTTIVQVQNPEYYKSKDPKAYTPHNPLERPTQGGHFSLIYWYVVYPIYYTCTYTIPDCRTEKYRNWYLLTFTISMMWISFYSYFMVWMITIIGATFEIPDTVMGLTFVAAGVSVPDALSSIAVIKEGYGDMAVSNAVGSNVFDILVCLGLPWFLKTTIISPGAQIKVISKGLAYSTLSLLSTVIFLLFAIHFNGWKLDRRLGIILMIWYVLFIVLASLYELRLFHVDNPTCALSEGY